MPAVAGAIAGAYRILIVIRIIEMPAVAGMKVKITVMYEL